MPSSIDHETGMPPLWGCLLCGSSVAESLREVLGERRLESRGSRGFDRPQPAVFPDGRCHRSRVEERVRETQDDERVFVGGLAVWP